MLQNTPNCTIDKKSGEYAPILLNIVCAIIHYLLFLYKKLIFLHFFYKILAKYSPKRTKLHHFKNFLRGACPQTPLTNAWLRNALHGASRRANTPTITKIFSTPPPRNEILDTPLLEVQIEHLFVYNW